MKKYSESIISMTTSFMDIMLNLHLDNPGVGWFSWTNEIENRIPRSKYLASGFRLGKENYKNNIMKIMGCARDQGVIIERKGEMYTITNIAEFVKNYHHLLKLIPPPFKTPEVNKAIWPNAR